MDLAEKKFRKCLPLPPPSQPGATHNTQPSGLICQHNLLKTISFGRNFFFFIIFLVNLTLLFQLKNHSYTATAQEKTWYGFFTAMPGEQDWTPMVKNIFFRYVMVPIIHLTNTPYIIIINCLEVF